MNILILLATFVPGPWPSTVPTEFGDPNRHSRQVPFQISSTSASDKEQAWQLHLKMQSDSPYKDLKWRAMGPRLQGSRISCFSKPNGNSPIVYVGVGLGGLWKSVNNGTTWTPIFDGQATQSIGDVAVAPSNPNVVWLGTGESLMSGNSTPGAGMYRSTDAGKTWNFLGLRDTHHIGRVIVDPKNADIAYVAAVGHNYSSNIERGLFKTTDGGKTWEHSLAIDDKTGVIDLAMDPNNSRTLYATAWRRERGGQRSLRGKESGIYKTTNAGKSWIKLGGGFPDNDHVGRVGIDISRSNPKVLYALLDSDIAAEVGLYRTGDAGTTWTKVNKDALKPGWDWCKVRVSPEDENSVYLPGQRTLASKDGGQTFTQVAGTLVHMLPHGSSVLHLDAHAMWIDPENPDHILLGNDGGFHVSWDRGTSWLHHNNIPVAESYALSYDSAKPYNIYVGTQDNAALFGPSNFVLKDGEPDAWKHVFLDPWGGGDAFYTVRDPSNPDFVYFEQQMGELQRKNMRTGEVQNIKPKAGKDEPALRFNWMSPYVISHHDPKSLYFGANHIFKSDNRGDSWSKVSPDLATVLDAAGKPQNGTITTISESRLKQGVLYVGNDRGTVNLTIDDGKSWKQVGEDFPRLGVSRVLASAFAPGTAYVSLSGFRNDHTSPYLFKSKDFGATWTSIVGNLPAEAIYVVIEDPRDSRTLYVGTDLGVYVSTNEGETWQSLCKGLPALRIFDLFLHPETFELVAGTHGRGVYMLDAKNIKRS
jgi:photosystem II stability/assembly factor-like uncharacterized protein